MKNIRARTHQIIPEKLKQECKRLGVKAIDVQVAFAPVWDGPPSNDIETAARIRLHEDLNVIAAAIAPGVQARTEAYYLDNPVHQEGEEAQ